MKQKATVKTLIPSFCCLRIMSSHSLATPSTTSETSNNRKVTFDAIFLMIREDSSATDQPVVLLLFHLLLFISFVLGGDSLTSLSVSATPCCWGFFIRFFLIYFKCLSLVNFWFPSLTRPRNPSINHKSILSSVRFFFSFFLVLTRTFQI